MICDEARLHVVITKGRTGVHWPKFSTNPNTDLLKTINLRMSKITVQERG